MSRPENQSQPFELLHHGKWVQAIAFAIVRDYQLAEDVRQDVFVAALEGGWSGAKVRKQWLAATSKHRALNIIRARRRLEERNKNLQPSEGGPNPADIAEAIEAQKQILVALSRLSSADQRLIYLRFYEGWSISQIANQLEINVGAARSRLHRALAALRKQVGGIGEDWRSCCLSAMAVQAIPHQATLVGAIVKAFALVLFVGVTVIIFRSSYLPLHLDGQVGISEANPDVTSLRVDERQAVRTKVEFQSAGDNHKDQALKGSDILKESAKVLREGVVLHQSSPVPGATIRLFRQGRVQELTSDSSGRFLIETDPDQPFVVTCKSGDQYGVAGNRSKPLILDLNPINSYPPNQITVVDGQTNKPVAGANIELIIPENRSANSWVQEIGNGEVIVEGVTNEDGKLQLEMSPFFSLMVVRANHAQAGEYFGALSWSWSDGGHIQLRKHQGYQLCLLDSSGAGIPGAVIWAGFPIKRKFITDKDGVVSSSWIYSVRSSGGAAIKNREMTISLPSGKACHFQRNALQGYAEAVWVANEKRLVVKINEDPVTVSIDGQIPIGLNVDVARVADPLDVTEANLKQEKRVFVGGGISFQWHALPESGSLLVNDGFVGSESWVMARDRDSRALIGLAPVISGKAELELKMARVDLTVPDSFSGIDDSWILKFDLDGGSVENKFPDPVLRVEGNRIVGWVPEANYKISLGHLEGWGKCNVAPDLICSYSGGAEADLRGGAMIGTLVPPTSELRRIQIRVNGVPILGGKVNGQPIELDGFVRVPCPTANQANIHSAELFIPGEVHNADGGPVLVSSFLPFYRHPIPLVGEANLIWNIELATIHLDLAGRQWAEEDVLRYLPLPQTKDDDNSDYFNWSRMDQFEVYRPSSHVREPHPLRVKDFGHNGRIRVPAGRYRIKLAGVFFTPMDGANFEPGAIHILAPME